MHDSPQEAGQLALLGLLTSRRETLKKGYETQNTNQNNFS